MGNAGTGPTAFRAEINLTQAQASASFVYDGLGRCVKRTMNGVVTTYAYDGWKPIMEWDGTGNWTAWNIYGPGADEILLRNSPTLGYLRYHHDIHGNVMFLLDGNGNGLERYTYDAFGRPKTTDWNGVPRTQSAYNNRFMFTGREYFPQLGLYDYRHRMYQPELGRFLQTDPTGFDAGDMNLFRYCADDPVDRVDPDGTIDRDAVISRDIIWEMAKHFESANISQASFAQLSAAWGRAPSEKPSGGAPMRFVPRNLAKDGVTAVPKERTHSGGDYEYQFSDSNGRRRSGAGLTVLEKLEHVSGVEVLGKQTKPAALNSSGIFRDHVGLDHRPGSSHFNGLSSVEKQTFVVTRDNGTIVPVSTVFGHE